jgi:hypothetical protein
MRDIFNNVLFALWLVGFAMGLVPVSIFLGCLSLVFWLLGQVLAAFIVAGLFCYGLLFAVTNGFGSSL